MYFTANVNIYDSSKLLHRNVAHSAVYISVYTTTVCKLLRVSICITCTPCSHPTCWLLFINLKLNDGWILLHNLSIWQHYQPVFIQGFIPLLSFSEFLHVSLLTCMTFFPYSVRSTGGKVREKKFCCKPQLQCDCCANNSNFWNLRSCYFMS